MDVGAICLFVGRLGMLVHMLISILLYVHEVRHNICKQPVDMRK